MGTSSQTAVVTRLGYTLSSAGALAGRFSGLAEAVDGRGQPRDLARGGLLRKGALAGGLREGHARFSQGLGRCRRILRSDRRARGLDLRANRAPDATVSQR